MVVHTCNPSIWEREAEGSKTETSLGSIVRPCLKEKERERKRRDRDRQGDRQRKTHRKEERKTI
jgi:hypothetical protein